MSDTNDRSGERRLAVFAINENKEPGKPARWTKIGVAFTNRDDSITLLLNALPIGTAKLQIREQRDDERWGANGASGLRPPPAGEEALP
ncbi:MAG TPA: hypothetical protein VLU43_03060 [Anaeromyxobacteraceae bacterium]|nr:hypothetical protein [Anaeromyxobacteraceae bacterium]